MQTPAPCVPFSSLLVLALVGLMALWGAQGKATYLLSSTEPWVLVWDSTALVLALALVCGPVRHAPAWVG